MAFEVRGYIGEWPNTAEAIRQYVEYSSDEDKVIEFTGDGGSYIHAIEILNYLSTQPQVEGVITTFASSATLIAALGCKKLSMCENALALFHPPLALFGDTATEQELRDRADSIAKCKESLRSSLVARTKLTTDEIEKLLATKETWLTPEQCVAYGIVTKICPVKKRNRSVVAHQGMPLEIVAFVNSKEDQMDMKELAAKLGVTCEAGKEGESIVAFVSSMKQAPTPAPQPPKKEEKKFTPPEWVVNLVTKTREDELARLVEAGSLTPAAADKIRPQFVTKEIVAQRMNDVGEVIDGFDAIVASYKENTPAMKYGSTHKVHNSSAPAKSVLLADMERRIEGGTK